MRYEFNAYGNTLTVTETDLADSLDSFADLGAAMVIANRELLWKNPESKDGEWELCARDSDIQRYRWTESFGVFD